MDVCPQRWWCALLLNLLFTLRYRGGVRGTCFSVQPWCLGVVVLSGVEVEGTYNFGTSERRRGGKTPGVNKV